MASDIPRGTPDAIPQRSMGALVQALIGSGHGLSHFYQLALPPLFPLIQAEFGVSYAALGLLLTLFSATTGGFQIVAGLLVDRVGARLLLIGGLAISGTAMGAIGFVDTYWAMAVLVVVAGIGNAVFHPADYVILNASVPLPRMGQAFSIHTFTGLRDQFSLGIERKEQAAGTWISAPCSFTSSVYVSPSPSGLRQKFCCGLRESLLCSCTLFADHISSHLSGILEQRVDLSGGME